MSLLHDCALGGLADWSPALRWSATVTGGVGSSLLTQNVLVSKDIGLAMCVKSSLQLFQVIGSLKTSLWSRSIEGPRLGVL